MNVAAGHTLVLDGQAETDTYRVYTTGSRGSSRNYVANVLDTGARGELDDGTPDNGVDELYVYGSESATEGYLGSRHVQHPVDDLFLLRRVTGIAGEAADRPAFVALLHTTLATAAPTGITTLGSGRVRRGAHRLRHRDQRPPHGLWASAATTTSPPTTTPRSRPSTAAAATTRSRSASSTA